MSGLKSVIKKKKKVVSESTGASAMNEPTYIVDVVDKLRNRADYRDKSEEELKQKAKELTDINELKADFSHLTDGVFEQYAGEIADEASASLGHSKELEQAQFRATRRLEPPRIKLHLFELRRPISRFFSKFSKIFALKYGPLHAAVQVGDVMLEWGTSSLVIPERYDPGDTVFQTDLKNKSTAAKVAMDMQSRLADAVQKMDYNEQLDIQFEATKGVEEMIEKIKEVIVKYNRFRYYKVVVCNCQTFVNDILKEIGAKNVPGSLTGKLKDYFYCLTTKKSKGMPSDFSTHESLDEYVRSQDLKKLTQHDKEYLLCLYFQFHLQAMKTDKDPEEQCCVEGCCMSEIETNLEVSSMLLEEFLG